MLVFVLRRCCGILGVADWLEMCKAGKMVQVEVMVWWNFTKLLVMAVLWRSAEREAMVCGRVGWQWWKNDRTVEQAGVELCRGCIRYESGGNGEQQRALQAGYAGALGVLGFARYDRYGPGRGGVGGVEQACIHLD